MARNWLKMTTVVTRGVFALVVALLSAACLSAQVFTPPQVRGVLIRAAGPQKAADVRGKETKGEECAENVFLPPDRGTLRKLNEAGKLIQEGRHREAIRNLGDILDAKDDFLFQPEKNSPRYSSLKAEAERLIGAMPREGRELYELQYGARARQMLDEALDSGDISALAEVSRRFFHTAAGYQATFLLGVHHFDQGRPLAGALVLERLRDAGPAARELEPSLSLTLAACWLRGDSPEKAREVLTALRKRNPSLRVKIAGREAALFTNDDDAVRWLSELIGPTTTTATSDPDGWRMFRGDAARNAPSAGGVPLLIAQWRVLAAADPSVETALEQFRRSYAEQKIAVVPSLYPLAVGDVLLMRTVENLLAVDFATGKRLWESPVDAKPSDVAKDGDDGAASSQSNEAAGALQRVWKDLTYGTLSSDGRRVYSVEDLGMELGAGLWPMFRGGLFAGVNRRFAPQSPPFDRLAARDIRTGKLVWELGGPSGRDALRLAETFFLGPPLVLMERLYVIAEVKGEIQLLALESATGDLLWSRRLAMAVDDASYATYRRRTGASPSYADGVLVCPTSTGAIVGIDPTTQSFLWGFCYNREQSNRYIGGVAVVQSGLWKGGWADGGIAIRGGRVLASPLESNWLYCLNLIDGRLLWKCPRRDDLYVACATRNNVVLVGRKAVRALKLGDGTPAWKGRAVELPKDAAPSGRGFLSGDRYFLPLTNAEVIGIDLAEGRVACVSKSRQGTVPGNLICHRGKILSQGFNAVDAYFQSDVLSAEVERRLAANPRDADAMLLQGEIFLNSDRRAEAVAAFRRAYEWNGSSKSRGLLRETLFEGLRDDFAAYRGNGEEIEQLLDTASQRATFLRLMAVGLRREGAIAEAFERYRTLADLEPAHPPLDLVERSWLVRRDRWVRCQLAELREEANADTASEIDAYVAERWKNAGGVKTSRDEPPLPRREDAVLAAWPTGKVEVATAPTKSVLEMRTALLPVEWRGVPSPSFRDLSFRFDSRHGELVAYDGWNREQWRLAIKEKGPWKDFVYSPATTFVRADGHLLLVSLGRSLVAIDAAGLRSGGSPKLLWQKEYSAASPDLAIASSAMPWLPQQQIFRASGQTAALATSPSQGVYIQRFQSLTSLDPRSGEPLWTRRNLPSSYILFGDAQYVFVVPPDQAEAQVFRASDGKLLGTRKVLRFAGRQTLPDGEQRDCFVPFHQTYFASLGRMLLRWRPNGPHGQNVLAMIDPWEDRTLWSTEPFAANARVCVVDDEAAGVMESGGRFVLVRLADGKILTDRKLEAEPSLQQISLLRSCNRYFLTTYGLPDRGVAMPQIQPIPTDVYRPQQPIYRGRMYAFEPDGKLAWAAPATLRNQLLVAGQPPWLPAWVFACRICRQGFNNAVRCRTTILCLDKRNGRVVYQGDAKDPAVALRIGCNPSRKTIVLTLQQDTVTLTFTDNPATSGPPASDESAESSSEDSVPRAVWDSIRRAIESGVEETGKKK